MYTKQKNPNMMGSDTEVNQKKNIHQGLWASELSDTHLIKRKNYSRKTEIKDMTENFGRELKLFLK